MKGHKDHTARMHHHGVAKHAKGGGVAQVGPHQEETNKMSQEKMLHEHEHDGKDRGHMKKEVMKKKGGEVKRKRGGMVPGKKSEPRLDKRARGGRTGSPEHPFSGATAENLSYAHGNLKAGSEGEGKDKT